MGEREKLQTQGSVIAVIGGTSPIGREAAKMFLERGSDVLILDTEVGDTVVDLGRTQHGKGTQEIRRILFRQTDFSDSSLEEACSKASLRFAGRDIVGIVNCSERDVSPEIAGIKVVDFHQPVFSK